MNGPTDELEDLIFEYDFHEVLIDCARCGLTILLDLQEFVNSTNQHYHCNSCSTSSKETLSLSQLSAKKVSQLLRNKENLNKLVKAVKLPNPCIQNIEQYFQPL